jgi:hypothetical protein
MNPSVKQAIEAFLAKVTQPGKIIGAAEMKELQARLSHTLPDWYEELLSTYPLAGMSLEYPIYAPDGDDDGFQTLKIARTRDIYAETEEAYPGLAIKDLGYVCLATDSTGGGDPYFMKVKDKGHSPVFQVYHDVSDVGTEIEAGGMEKIADSLAEFFTKARPDTYHNPYEKGEEHH